jgi:prepilin-type N-terminal cleavage/methylation domain-containing protein
MNANLATRETESKGFTLLELTMAMAIFSVAIAVAAQSLISFYAIVDMQNQRVVAMNQCRATLSQMRTARTTSLATVLTQYPVGYSVAGPAQLRNSTISVAYEGASPATANPLVPTVTVAWLDLRGHAVNVRLTTALADQ